MTTDSSTPHGSDPTEGKLRLVGDHTARSLAAESIAEENRASGDVLAPHDPRWVLAARTAAQLEGSLLTPERRQRILQTADRLGIQRFDASVIIALVQDESRRGGGLATLGPRLALTDARQVVDRSETQRATAMRLRWLAALVLAACVVTLIRGWMLAGAI